jgi:glycosyltransferase involved in cell wall biosynthesis
MAMGKPLVTTDVGSVNQYVEDGVSGYIVPVRDVDGLSDRVKRLLNDPSLRKRMGAAAREVAVAKLGVDAAAMKHAEIYRLALAAVGTGDQLAE